MKLNDNDINLIASAIRSNATGGGDLSEFIYDLTFRNDRVGDIANYLEENMGEYISGYDLESKVGDIFQKILNAIDN